MKKYFVKETDEELVYGDVISINFVKELEDGTVSREMEVKFTPEMVDTLKELDIIEEVDEDELIEFDEDSLQEYVEELDDDLEALEKRVEELEKGFGEFCDKMMEETQNLIKTVEEAIEKGKKEHKKCSCKK